MADKNRSSDLIEDTGTGSTPATGSRDLTESAGYLRSYARVLSEDTDDLHQRTYIYEWNVRTTEWARRSVAELLEELADLGFSWRHVARMMGVSVPALRKWRNGEKASGENRYKLAALVAGCHQVMDDYAVSEVASWFETPVLYPIPVTPVELWASLHPDLVIEHASGHSDAEAVLTAFDPEWRERYRTSVETVVHADGSRSLRVKD